MSSPCELHAIDLDAVPALVLDFLSPEERLRAAAFHFERDRRRWVAGRGALRILLARHTASSPRGIKIGSEPTGRPYLVGSATGIDFNISHADGQALIGITFTGRLGVDVEPYARGCVLYDCREAFCSTVELERVDTLQTKLERERELIKIWCAKEAHLKAIGTGLDESLKFLTTRWNSHGNALLSGKVQGSPSYSIHFPSDLEMAGYCAATALPEGMACPRIQQFECCYS